MTQIHPDRIPRHVAIIMDGNGRWAEERGMDRIQGHMAGVESVRNAVRASRKLGIEYLTLYAFSTENWGRPADEVNALMGLLCQCCAEEVPELNENEVRLRFIGDRPALSPEFQEVIRQSEADTAHNTKMTLLIALNYSSRWEITRMVRLLAEEVKSGELALDDITCQQVSDHLTTAGIPDPDLLIRTSGEHRLSNFLLWQLSYSELYFTDIYWPDFDERAFELAVADYQCRQRRYGLIHK